MPTQRKRKTPDNIVPIKKARGRPCKNPPKEPIAQASPHATITTAVCYFEVDVMRPAVRALLRIVAEIQYELDRERLGERLAG